MSIKGILPKKLFDCVVAFLSCVHHYRCFDGPAFVRSPLFAPRAPTLYNHTSEFLGALRLPTNPTKSTALSSRVTRNAPIKASEARVPQTKPNVAAALPSPAAGNRARGRLWGPLQRRRRRRSLPSPHGVASSEQPLAPRRLLPHKGSSRRLITTFLCRRERRGDAHRLLRGALLHSCRSAAGGHHRRSSLANQRTARARSSGGAILAASNFPEDPMFVTRKF